MPPRRARWRWSLELGADAALETHDGFIALDLAASYPLVKLLRKVVSAE